MVHNIKTAYVVSLRIAVSVYFIKELLFLFLH